MSKQIGHWNRRLRRVLSAASILLLLVVTTGCIPREWLLSTLNFQNFSELRQSSQDILYTGQEIIVDNFIGRIIVEGVDLPAFVAGRPRVSVEWIKRVRNLPLDELEVDIDSDSETIYISTNAPDTIGHKLTWIPPFIEERVGLVEFRIRVPKEADLHLMQVVGMIEVSNFDGNLQIDQNSGVSLDLAPEFPTILVRESNLNELTINGQASDVALQQSTFHKANLSTKTGNLTVEIEQTQSVHVYGETKWSEIMLIGAENISPDLIERETSWPGQRLQMLVGNGDSDLILNSEFGLIKIEILHH